MTRESLEKIEGELKAAQDTIKNLMEIMQGSLKDLEKKVGGAIDCLNSEKAKREYLNNSEGFVPSVFLDFPDHLRLTLRALLELGIGSAEEVSKKTARSRSLESSYLNTLVTMGHVKKERKDRVVYYSILFKETKELIGDKNQ